MERGEKARYSQGFDDDVKIPSREVCGGDVVNNTRPAVRFHYYASSNKCEFREIKNRHKKSPCNLKGKHGLSQKKDPLY